MSKKILKIAYITSEISPFSKTGGLGDVSRSLAKAVKRQGQEVIVITPFYEQIIDQKKHGLKLYAKDIAIEADGETHIFNFWKGYLMKDLPVYFAENKKYFSKRKAIYGSTHENLRFYLFDLAALKLLSHLNCNPDIIHCHDWQTGLIPYMLKSNGYRNDNFPNSKTVFTIHNLAFQLGRNWWEVPPGDRDDGRRNLPNINDQSFEYVNFVKRAVHSADVINTVSEQYREEILTKEYGQDMEKILKQRRDWLFGIVNGIDYKAYNPDNDPGLKANFNENSIHRKKENKLFLQKLFGLNVDSTTPLICSTSRVTFQKGFELILNIAEHLMNLDMQFLVIGAGDKKMINRLKKIAKKHPHKLAIAPSHELNQKYETLAYAGSDFFLLPSHYEPCGINQMIAMRYGCIPIVRKVGGLHDTVENLNPEKNTGTGFTFQKFSEFSLYAAIIRALETYKYSDAKKQLIIRAMKKSSSWEIPATKYIDLYKKALRKKD